MCALHYSAVLGSLGPGHQCVCLVVIIIKIVSFDHHWGSFQVALLRLLKYTQKKRVPSSSSSALLSIAIAHLNCIQEKQTTVRGVRLPAVCVGYCGRTARGGCGKKKIEVDGRKWVTFEP